jgi:NAD(P)-dependent dehydrogenase (short-subunit alcohol dehydrogenase family)
VSAAAGSLFSVQDRVALVTGGGTGIGRGSALVLAEHGADVVVVGRRLAPLEGTADRVQALGRRALVLQGDVTDPDQCKELVARTVSDFGHLDILVNNAGASDTRPMLSWTPQQWQEVVALNLSSAWYMSQAAALVMVAQGKGAIVNISSGASTGALPWAVPYAAAKAGLNNLTGTMAAALTGQGIRINALVVGAVRTEFMVEDTHRHGLAIDEMGMGNAMGRVGQPEEIGYAVLFLASDAASFISGQSIGINGGPLGPPDPPLWDESKKADAVRVPSESRGGDGPA